MRFVEVLWGTVLYAATVELRYQVLRAPLSLWFCPAELLEEKADRHFAALAGSKVVACLVASRLDSGRAKVRQMAVDEESRGRGTGAGLLVFAEGELQADGCETFVLHARETAVWFYQKLGYGPEGEPFVEVTLPHRRMVKSLTRP